jgi:cytochrome bd-type quinol oxidase subunit 2
MKSPAENQTNKTRGYLSSCSGCLVSALLFPFFMTLSGWLAFALGPMGCAYPSKCSQSQENAKGILSMVILFGGGFGIPIGTGILVGKVVQNGVRNRAK